MSKTLKRVVSIIVAFAMITGICICDVSETVFASSAPTLTYNAHLQNIGWQGWKSGGATAGTTGQSRQMEAIRIKLSKNGTSMITYRAHVQSYGWLGWVQSGEVAGTTGQSYRLEGIQIKLKNEYASQYDIYYRMHISKYGWLGWARNGEIAGSEGIGLPAEAIEIKLVRKGEYFNRGGQASYARPGLSYRAHCANIGWMNTVNEADTAGTTGSSRRMEALYIYLKDFTNNNGIFYRAHVSNIGWQDWKSSGQMMGTTGQSKQMEAVEIKLSDSLSPCFDIYYRVHVSNVGWLGWAKNGETAGSTGQSLAIEAIQIKLEHKGTNVDVGGTAVYQSTASGSSGSGDIISPVPSGSKFNRKTWDGDWYGYHDINVNVNSSTPVYAITDGTVTYKQAYRIYGGVKYLTSYGNYIEFTSADRVYTAKYCHLSSFEGVNLTIPSSRTRRASGSSGRINLVTKNVKKGEVLGYIGTTGNSSGLHLHFELRKNGSRIDPTTVITGLN